MLASLHFSSLAALAPRNATITPCSGLVRSAPQEKDLVNGVAAMKAGGYEGVFHARVTAERAAEQALQRRAALWHARGRAADR